MKYIRFNDEGNRFTFFNGKYYFTLKKDWIKEGYRGYWFSVNVVNIDLLHNLELIKKYPRKIISKKEINEQIQIIREKFPELML